MEHSGEDRTRLIFWQIAGGAGLAGGLLLAEAFEGHERHERREEDQAFDQGGSNFFTLSFFTRRS
jgi:hypothetical protein